MAVFECNRCGRCCVSLGPHVTIERQMNDRDYYCRSVLDNAFFYAHVDPEYHEEIADEFESGQISLTEPEKKTCWFLRKNHEGEGTACAIYASRPQVCRDFRCYCMLVRDRNGAVCGRVTGKNSLCTDNVALQKLWDEQVLPIPCGEVASWTKLVAGILAERGYYADPLE